MTVGDLLARFPSVYITGVVLCEHITGVVITFGQGRFTDICEWTPVQRLVMIWFTESVVRGMVPRKSHIEHPMEKPFVYVTDVADRHLVVDTPNRAWFPQRMSVI